MPLRTIQIHVHAPTKPAEGAPCNGCGLCCTAAPCPLGMWVSRRRQGACAALTWNERETLYRCGVVDEPALWLPWLSAALAHRLALRWIGAAAGCDSDLQAQTQP